MKKYLAMALAVSACMAIGSQSYAATATETYTVAIPTVTNVVLHANTTAFGAITSSDFGIDAPAAHTILVGDGTAASTSYVESNNPAAGASQYTIAVGPGVGTTMVSLAAGTGADAGKAVLTVTGPGAAVDIRLEDSGKTTMPKLGDGAGAKSFAVSGSTLNVAATSSVPFNAATAKAPLNLLMDLNEATVTMGDTAGSMGFTLTLTAVSI